MNRTCATPSSESHSTSTDIAPGKAFVDIGNAPADQSNRRTDLQDYSAWEIYLVLQGPSDMMIRNNALWKRRAYEEKPLYLGKHRKSIGQKFSFGRHAGWFAAKSVTSDSPVVRLKSRHLPLSEKKAALPPSRYRRLPATEVATSPQTCDHRLQE
jgi:hypothetical protein